MPFYRIFLTECRHSGSPFRETFKDDGRMECVGTVSGLAPIFRTSAGNGITVLFPFVEGSTSARSNVSYGGAKHSLPAAPRHQEKTRCVSFLMCA